MIFYAAETIAVKIDKSLVSRLSRPGRGWKSWMGRGVVRAGIDRPTICERRREIFANKSKTNDSSIIIIPRMRVYLYVCDYLERKGVNLYSKKGGKERMEDNEEES